MTYPVVLTPLLPSDAEAVYYLSVDPRSGAAFRYRGTTPSPEVVWRHVFEGAFAVHAIRLKSSERFLGYSALYNANPMSGYAFLGALGTRDPNQRGAISAGAILVLQRAFDFWSFRKIYVEVLASTETALVSGLRRFAKEEGRLRNHELISGQHLDLVTYAIYRENWSEIRAAYLRIASGPIEGEHDSTLRPQVAHGRLSD